MSDGIMRCCTLCALLHDYMCVSQAIDVGNSIVALASGRSNNVPHEDGRALQIKPLQHIVYVSKAKDPTETNSALEAYWQVLILVFIYIYLHIHLSFIILY
jgi:hypothetical protein